MRKFLLYIIPAILLLSACGKEKSFEVLLNQGGGGSNPQYFIKCKIDGVDKTFNVGATAIKQTDPNTNATNYSILGKATTDANDMETFTISISSSAAITTGTYKISDLSGNFLLLGLYTLPISTNIIYTSSNGFPDSNPFEITISSLNSTEIAGTFTGELFEIDSNNPTIPGSGSAVKTITNGEFKVKFQ